MSSRVMRDTSAAEPVDPSQPRPRQRRRRPLCCTLTGVRALLGCAAQHPHRRHGARLQEPRALRAACDRRRVRRGLQERGQGQHDHRLQVSSCGCRTFYSCHPKQALAGVGQPGGRAGVVTPRGGSNPAPGLTLPACCSTRPRPCSSSPSSRPSSEGSSRSRCCRVSCRAAAREQLSRSDMPRWYIC